jgi:hypothetical protein
MLEIRQKVLIHIKGEKVVLDRQSYAPADFPPQGYVGQVNRNQLFGCGLGFWLSCLGSVRCGTETDTLKGSCCGSRSKYLEHPAACVVH